MLFRDWGVVLAGVTAIIVGCEVDPREVCVGQGCLARGGNGNPAGNSSSSGDDTGTGEGGAGGDGVVTPGSSGRATTSGGRAAGTGGGKAQAGAAAGGRLGTAGAAGSGTGGSRPCTLTRASGTNPLVDDFEAYDAFIAPVDGRQGPWFIYDDGTGGLRVPAGTDPPYPETADALNGTLGALYVEGESFLDWGFVLSNNLNAQPNRPEFCAHDVSLYLGITFRAIGTGTVTLKVPTTELMAQNAMFPGGTCVPTTTLACDNTYAIDVPLQSDRWRTYIVYWGDLAQQLWANPYKTAPLNLGSVARIEFSFPAGGYTGMGLDDVKFISQ